MKTLKQLIEGSIRELPQEPFARWASIFLTLFVFTVIFSITASQLFLALAGLAFLLGSIRRRRAGSKSENRNSKLGEQATEAQSDFRFPGFEFRPLRQLAWPILLFCLLTVLSALWAANPAAGGFQIRKLVLFLIIVFSLNLIASLSHLERLLGATFVASAAAGAVAAVQFATQYRAVRAEHPGGVYAFMTYTRITGFQGDWMNFGGQQMLVWLILIAFLLLGGRACRQGGSQARPSITAFAWVAAGIIAISILLTFTRGVWLGSFVGGLYLVGRRRARWLWAAPLLLLAIVLLSPHLVRQRVESVLHPSRDASLAARFEMWHAGWRMIRRHPWLGVGPNNVNEVYDLYLPPGKPPQRGYHEHLHSDYIQLAAERGVPCLAAWLWLMGVLGSKALKVRRSNGRGRWIAEGAFAAWLAFMIEGFFEFNFGTSPVLMVFLFVATTPFIVERIEAAGAAAP